MSSSAELDCDCTGRSRPQLQRLKTARCFLALLGTPPSPPNKNPAPLKPSSAPAGPVCPVTSPRRAGQRRPRSSRLVTVSVFRRGRGEAVRGSPVPAHASGALGARGRRQRPPGQPGPERAAPPPRAAQGPGPRCPRSARGTAGLRGCPSAPEPCPARRALRSHPRAVPVPLSSGPGLPNGTKGPPGPGTGTAGPAPLLFRTR